MRRLTVATIALTLLAGCYIPPRPLPGWKADQLARQGRVSCRAWTKGQRLGDGKRVMNVGRGYVTIRLKTGEYINMPCKP